MSEPKYKQARSYSYPESYEPSASAGVDYVTSLTSDKHFRRMTSSFAMFEVLHAFKSDRVTLLEVMNYLSAHQERDIEGAVEWGQKHPEYETHIIVGPNFKP